ncbi:MAG: hypothetical protein GY694_11000 [Gammaproteobacteria bacterium]|nr:hypothetical protein [Gammaproteobacteria bacterium]
MFYNRPLVLFLLFILSGCQSALILSDDVYTSILNKGSIEITQPIDFLPNSARAFLQKGELITSGELNLYAVNCEVEINTVSEERQTIEAGIFYIVSISQDESPIVDRQREKSEAIVASLELSRGLLAWDSDSPVDIKRFYKFKLLPQDVGSRNDVRSVVCRGAQDSPYNAELPSFEEIRAASGKYLIFNF